MKRPYGSTSAAIIASLERDGPATRAELCARLGMDRMYASAVINRLSKATARSPRRVYIAAYVYDQDGSRKYPRAIYDAGDKPDAAKPKPRRLETRRAYNNSVRLRHTTNFVFNLGLTREAIRDMRRPAPVASVFALGDRARSS